MPRPPCCLFRPPTPPLSCLHTHQNTHCFSTVSMTFIERRQRVSSSAEYPPRLAPPPPPPEGAIPFSSSVVASPAAAVRAPGFPPSSPPSSPCPDASVRVAAVFCSASLIVRLSSSSWMSRCSGSRSFCNRAGRRQSQELGRESVTEKPLQRRQALLHLWTRNG